MGPGIAVIIVNYGTAGLAIRAVESVRRGRRDDRPVAIHLVDNGSPGHDATLLRVAHAERGWSTDVTLHLAPVNGGFGRGNNLVLEALDRADAPPAHVFLLNPDAQVDRDALALLAAFLDDHREVAAVGAAIARPDGHVVPSAFAFPSIFSTFADASGLGTLARLARYGRSVAEDDRAPRPTDWVSGAATMIRFAALREVGFFDPDFFLYFEETELMLRLRRAGHAIWTIPAARVTHIAGAATGMRNGRHVSRARPGYWYDSWRLYHVKARGPMLARVAALAHLAGAGVDGVLRRIRRRPARVPERFLGDFGRHVLRPLFLGDPAFAPDRPSRLAGDRP